MKKLFKGLTFIATAVSVMLVSACGNEPSNPGTDNNGESQTQTVTPPEINDETMIQTSLTIGTVNDIPCATPFGNSNIQTQILTNSTFTRLIEYDGDMNIIPGLATSWESNEDSTVWTFNLREGVYFHSGDEFTAEDVKFTFEYAGSRNNEGITFPINGMEFVDDIIVENDYKVTFHLAVSVADWEYQAAQKIMSQAAVERYGIQVGGAIGTGAFEFVEHNPNVSWTMVRNENYWGELPVTEEITFKVITDSNTRAMALRSGDVDAIFDPAPSDTVQFMNDANFNVFQGDNTANLFLGFNHERVANDLKIRQAVAMGINRDDIVIAAFEGGEVGVPSFNFINEVTNGFAAVDAVGFDPEAAIELLAELGYDENNRLELNLAVFNTFISVAEIIQANLSQINIDVNVVEFSREGFGAAKRADGTFDMYIQQTSNTGGMLNPIQRFLLTDGASNNMFYSNPDLDALFEEAVGSPNLELLLEQFAEIQQLIADDLPAVPLVRQFVWVAGNTNFYGVTLGDQNYFVDFTNAFVVND